MLQIGAAALFLPLDNTMFLLCTALLITGLIAVCCLTGEKPRWRLGARKNESPPPGGGE